MKSTIDLLFNQRHTVTYNPETECVELSFKCQKIGMEIPNRVEQLFEDIVNDIEAPTGEYSTSFIYHQFLNAITNFNKNPLDNYAQQMSNDVIYRIGRYIGASHLVNGSYFRDDTVWERVHND